MADFCAPIKREDPHAFVGCLELKRLGYTFDQLNRGVTRLKYVPGTPPRRIPDGEGDQKISPSEVYNRLAQLAENEQMRLAHALLEAKTLPFPQKFKTPHFDFLKHQADTVHPAIFDLSNLRQVEFFKFTIKKIKLIRTELKSINLIEGSEEYIRQFSKKLFLFIREQKERGGLGITFSKNRHRSVRNLGEVLNKGRATCIEFVNLFFVLGKIANLPVIPLEVLKDENGKTIDHDLIGVRLDPKNKSRILFFDLDNEYQGEDLKDILSPMGRLELISRYYNQLPFNTPSDKKAILRSFKKARRYTPFDHITNTNFARTSLLMGIPSHDVLQALFTAYRSYHDYPKFYLGLGEFFEARGDHESARLVRHIGNRLNAQ